MSEENVEIVRRAFAEFERGNFWLPDLFEPTVSCRWLDAVGVESETVGLKEMSDFMLNWLEAFERLSLIAERLIDAGDKVVVMAAWRGTGKASGANTEWRHGSVWTLRDGRIASFIAYENPAEALEAAGLSEDPAE